jgi:hypothetical protein
MPDNAVDGRTRVQSGPMRHLLGIRAGLAVTAGLLALLVYQVALRVGELDILFRSRRAWVAIGPPAIGLLLAIAALAISWTRYAPVIRRLPAALVKRLARLGGLNWIGFSLVIAAYLFITLGPANRYLKGQYNRAELWWLFSLLGCVCLKAASPARNWHTVLLVTGSTLGMAYLAGSYFIRVSDFPFSLDWSETSRYYYASLFFSERVYGEAAPPPVLHPSRYLMQAVPFLIPGLPLWGHRLWQALLWMALPLVTAWFLAKRVFPAARPADEVPVDRWFFITWAFLFIFQGPVYYHLLVPVALILAGWSADGESKRWRLWGSWLVVLGASAWAGISRLNWFPVPGLLAALLYFLEIPTCQARPNRLGTQAPAQRRGSSYRYLLPPLAWVIVGTLSAFVAQLCYIRWSGVDPRNFATSFSSDLLWYRLFPSRTNPFGIIPAISLVSGPLLLLALRHLRGLHRLRVWGIAAICLVLFGGGLVVSVKIGGGSNLHNLDAFLTVVLICGSYAILGRIRPDDKEHPPALSPTPGLVGLMMLAAFIPAVFALSSPAAVALPDPEKTAKTLSDIRALVNRSVQRGGQVLFISQRHLLTFGMLPGVSLVPDYENVFLMEMAMGDNRSYLEQFYVDLERQKYALIISDPVNDVLKGSESIFGEENNVWVERVARPILQDYQSVKLFKPLGIEVLAPRPAP